MKKRIISMILVVIMVMTLIACGDTTNSGANTTPDNESVSTEQTNDATVPENGEAIIEGDTAAHEHNYVENVVKEATCTENGTASYVCECGDTYEEEIPANNHSWGEYTSNNDATYTADGTKTAKCSSCEATDTVADEGSKLSYTYTDGEAVKYAQQTVNLRSGPSTDFDKVGSLSTNDEVKVTGTCKETGWYRIAYGDGVAYVSNKYLGDAKVEISANSGNSGNPGSGGGAANSLANHFGVAIPSTITANNPFAPWTNLWNSNSSFNADSNFICHLQNGTQVTISNISGSKNDCMAYITMPDGTSGWACFSYKGTNYFTW